MNALAFRDDYYLSQEICDRLRSGDHESVLKIYSKYHILFSAFARKRLYGKDHSQAEIIVNKFWIELLKAKAICSYQGKTSLRNYLLTILNRRIIDANRKWVRDNNQKQKIEKLVLENSEEKCVEVSPEEILINKERMRLIHEALLQLETISTRDAYLMKMYLEGLSYKEMAEREMDPRGADGSSVNKKINAIKKQFTRPKTGTMARFKNTITSCLKDHDLVLKDLLN
jgi:RNA polymerase sigma-70 factor (ECF subfamily)